MGGRWRVVEGRAANVLGRIGETVGADWLIYSPLRIHQFHLMAQDDAAALAATIVSGFPQSRLFADVGCGSGAFAAALNRLGLVAIGCEHSRVGRMIARAQGVDARPFDLAQPRVPASLPTASDYQAFHVAYCIEVAEHVSAPLGDRLVEFCCQLAPWVLFSAASPGQGGTAHINEQPISYWAERFHKHGYAIDEAKTARIRTLLRDHNVKAEWLHANLTAFSKLPVVPPHTA